MPHPWFALNVKPRHEKFIAGALLEKGLETFLPLYRGRHRSSGRFKDVDLPLFPNYVFCRFDIYRRLPVLITPGVFSIVGFGKVPVPVEDAEIGFVQNLVRSGLDAQPWPFLQAGDQVCVEEGPLKGTEGILVTEKSNCRLVISVMLLQRSVSVEIDRRWIRPAAGVWTLPAAGLDPAGAHAAQ